jgi:hypothetical protein
MYQRHFWLHSLPHTLGWSRCDPILSSGAFVISTFCRWPRNPAIQCFPGLCTAFPYLRWLLHTTELPICTGSSDLEEDCPYPLEQAFSLGPLLLLNLTGPNWGWLEMQKGHRINRQTESWGQVCWVLGWRCTTLIASFFYYSLHLLCFLSLSLFFKTLLLYSSLKLCF